MNKRTQKFQARIEHIQKILQNGPMTYDELYKACGYDPQHLVKVMAKEDLIKIRKEKYGNNGNFYRSVYYLESQPDTPTHDINGWSDSLRVLMGFAPMRQYFIDGPVRMFDDEDFYQRHRENLRKQAPTIGQMKFGSMQSSFGDLEIYGAA